MLTLLWAFIQTPKAKAAIAIFLWLAALWMGAELSAHPSLIILTIVGSLVAPFLLFVPEIRRLRIVYEGNTRTDSPLWLYLFAIIGLSVVGISAVRLYRAASVPAPLGFEDLLQSYIHDRAIHITDLARTGTVIHDKTFERVSFVGPAMITPIENVDIITPVFDTDGGPPQAVYLEVPDNTPTVGVIALKYVIVKNCRFTRIQIIGNKELIARIKACAVSIPPSQVPPDIGRRY